MKEAVKEMIKSAVIAIGIALIIFCIVGIVFDVSFGGDFRMEHYLFTKMIVACAVIGLGFGVPSVVYRTDRLPMPLKVLIHMGIGIVVYTVTAYSVGWIGASASVRQGVIIAVIQIAVIVVIWFGFMFHYRREARQLNERIQDLKKCDL